jgi:4-amino-4-deoxy-L-arabinose transferase-like glycosyltransferase
MIFLANLERQQILKRSFWALVILRGFLNALIPLMDKTEARYAEIARIMAETQNWIVLQIDYGIPFWAKPPLSTWASALSISLFDASAFFVRLPYLIVCSFIGWWIGQFNRDKGVHYLPGIILLTLPEFFLHAGVVSTDVFLTLSTTIVMLAFWKSMQLGASKKWGYFFFVGLGLGLLAKGPLIGVLTLPPIVVWCLIQHKLFKALKTAPWLLGSLIMTAIALPWYILTEKASPGFIDYFIVGEHFNRYFNSEWVGDKYGFPKQQPYGIVWVFLFAFCLPWSIFLIQSLRKKIRTIRHHPWGLFLLFWMLWTPLFFSTSSSLIHPYILPVTIPVALWISHFWNENKKRTLYLGIGISIPVILFVVYLSGFAKPLLENNTDKYLIENSAALPIYALQKKTYSSQFYSQGKIKIVDTLGLKKMIDSNTQFKIIIDHRTLENISPKIKNRLNKKIEHKKRGIYMLKE